MIAVDNYYTNIPGEIMGDSKINLGAKLLFGRINSLSHKEGFCWACNRYLAGLMGVSARTIQRWIETLKKNNYIKSEIIYKEDSKEVACRKLLLNSMSSAYDRVVVGSHDKNVVELINNNTNKDYYNKKERNSRAHASNNSNSGYVDNSTNDEINKTLEKIKSLEKYLENLKNISQANQDFESVDVSNQQLSEATQDYNEPQVVQDFEYDNESNSQLSKEYSNCSQPQVEKESEDIDTPDLTSDYSDIFDIELKNKYSCLSHEEIKKTQQDNYTESIHDSMSTYGRESFDDITCRKISYGEERVKLGKYLAFIIRRFGKITNDMWEALLDRYLSLGNSVKERLANLAYSLAGGYRNIFKAPKHDRTQTQYSAISIFE